MPKTIAITPSWYWPADVDRVAGIPPFGLDEMLVDRVERHRAGDAVLVSGDTRLTGSELAGTVRAVAAGLASRAEPGSLVRLESTGHVDDIVLFLAALRAGLRVHLTQAGTAAGALSPALVLGGPGSTDASAVGVAALSGSGDAGAHAARAGVHDPVVALETASNAADGEGRPVVAWHSHRSLLAWAVSLSTFLGADRQTSFVVDTPLGTWSGLTAAATALLSGCTLVVPDAGEPVLDAVRREGAGYLLIDLEKAAALTREAKRDVKDMRGSLHALLFPTSGMYDIDARKRAGKLFGTNALTVWGLAETGPVFASHPSWYVDESVGIPITNAHVVPLEPRSLRPLSTLWELVTSARVSVRTPGQMAAYDDSTPVPGAFDEAGRFVTSTIASSDANGMIYVLPD
ncbi:MAG: AMP-binding protein [Acidimicrobiia bacterium]|nr:AMP-binding protein [Acidimicrobiia bacterium]